LYEYEFRERNFMSRGNLGKLADYMVGSLGMDEKKVAEMDSEEFLSEAMNVISLWSDVSVTMGKCIAEIALELDLDLGEIENGK
jgi:hypothetical protein